MKKLHRTAPWVGLAVFAAFASARPSPSPTLPLALTVADPESGAAVVGGAALFVAGIGLGARARRR